MDHTLALTQCPFSSCILYSDDFQVDKQPHLCAGFGG
jgi:hypothetical protein